MIAENQYDFKPSQLNETVEDTEGLNALNLKWTMGFNYKLINGTHNLTNRNRREIFYASAHTGVIYDYGNNTQRLLQGHCNKITATAYCVDEDLIVTADKGPDSMLVVWDAKTGTPKKTIFDPHPFGTESLDITPDGQYIVTISREESQDNLQTVSLWDWTQDKKPNVTCVLDPRIHDYQTHIIFNQTNTKEFCTTGKKRLLFWSWELNVVGFEFYSPLPIKKHFTQTVFIPGTAQAVTGCHDGHIVVWDISLIMENFSQPEERRKIKLVNLMNTSNKSETALKKGTAAIKILKIQGPYLVVGASNGSIRFYDFQYRIISWFEDIDVADITSISFANDPLGDRSESMRMAATGLDKEDKENEPFDCPEFIVVDYEAKITILKGNLFEEIDKDNKKGTLLLKSIVSPIICIAVRPNSNTLALACENGSIYEWDFHEKPNSLQHLRTFEPLKEKEKEPSETPSCIDYSPDGKYLAVATRLGSLYFYIYDYEKPDWQQSYLLIYENENKNKPRINYQVFASDSKHLATMNEDFSVCLFKIDHKYLDPTQPKEWIFSGKMRAHTLPLKSIAFGESLSDKGDIKLRLFSIGEDKRLIEYDVHNSTQENGVRVHSVTQIEQESNPCACVWYPINIYKEDCLLTVNEEYKIRLWQIMSNGTKICKKTCLGPSYGHPINKMLVLNPTSIKSQYTDNYLAYSTKEKIVGIIKLPLEGNPNNTMGLIAHPEKITAISATSDGKYLFTSGADDLAINIWYIDVTALEKNFFNKDVYGEEDPFPHFLEGGPNGQTYRDLKDFFYYSQIRAKDEHTTKARKLDGKVPLESISEMMRALGYYPSVQEIENMNNEIKYSKYENGQYVKELDLNMFVKLFVNHRPAYSIVKNQIEDALNTIVNSEENKEAKQITKERFLEILQKEGEKMSFMEIKECLNSLCGEGNPEELLPDVVEADVLIDEILGFEDMDAVKDKKENEEEDEIKDEDSKHKEEI